ncbi:sarcosine oxidase subunit gamma [Microbulbifer sp. S227A]|uniref:sarcosine oxidase subunit gamma n=1 Tax=Microbulbifer sp. S227A TaxID=3415131 RepID=UPI003C7C07AD
MPELLSALHRKTIPGRHGATGGEAITLGTRPLQGLWQLAGWDDFDAAAKPALDHLGLDGLGDYRTARAGERGTAWRIAPDRMLIETHADLSGFGSENLAVLDLGHARTVITLQGEAARTLLSQVVAVDVSATALAPGMFLQTGLHHVGVLIQCTGAQSFDILAPATWAESVWDVLYDNALPHGIRVPEAA